MAVPLAVMCALVSGCRSPVPFHGKPGPGSPVLSIGGPVPYVRPPSLSPAPHRPPSVLDQRGGLPDGPRDVYAATRAGMFTAVTRRLPQRVYVPDTSAGRVEVIDAATRQVLRRIPAGRMPQQVVPSWDLKTLWVTEAGGLMAIDARSGATGRTVSVDDPSDLYFSADGRQALVPLAHRGRIEVRAPHTLRSRSTISVPCKGLTRGDFSASGATLVIGCRTSARLERVDVERHRVTATLHLPAGARPKDVRLSPDGSTFYVADAHHGGVWLVDALRFRTSGFIHTGKGTHGLYPSRDSSLLYVANSGERTVSLISFATRRLVGSWPVPAAPDMGGVSADGQLLWLSAHDANTVFAVSTTTGRLTSRLQTGSGPHGVTVYPQPGRFSLGHTGLYR